MQPPISTSNCITVLRETRDRTDKSIDLGSATSSIWPLSVPFSSHQLFPAPLRMSDRARELSLRSRPGSIWAYSILFHLRGYCPRPAHSAPKTNYGRLSVGLRCPTAIVNTGARTLVDSTLSSLRRSDWRFHTPGRRSGLAIRWSPAAHHKSWAIIRLCNPPAANYQEFNRFSLIQAPHWYSSGCHLSPCKSVWLWISRHWSGWVLDWAASASLFTAAD